MCTTLFPVLCTALIVQYMKVHTNGYIFDSKDFNLDLCYLISQDYLSNRSLTMAMAVYMSLIIIDFI